MKKLLAVFAASAAFSGSLFAGAPMAPAKGVVPPEEPYGVGWYGALQGGVNAYQNLGGGVDLRDREGDRLHIEGENAVGGFGGLKLGYVWNTGFVRPAFEADLFYNGVDSGARVDFNGRNVANTEARIDSGAFMANALLRFNYQRFQPYFGFGLGYYVAQGNDISGNIGNASFGGLHSESTGGLAWQIVAGADYYFTPKLSAFFEYKFLNYNDCVFDKTAQQQLFGLGVRLHF
jgi:opacity protein-like surface antigen